MVDNDSESKSGNTPFMASGPWEILSSRGGEPSRIGAGDGGGGL